MTTAPDWDLLRETAREAMSHAYAPYSGYPVGAAALVDDGRVISGCNVENASFGLALCAECGLVSQLQATGGGRLTHFVCVDSRASPWFRAGAAGSSVVRVRRPRSRPGDPGRVPDPGRDASAGLRPGPASAK
ncbi:hypothetical protein STANM309S_00114 [Streptomyces tanashiensis]